MKKKWTIEVAMDNDNIEMTRTNCGFTSLELLGVLEMIRDSIMAQIRGDEKPEINGPVIEKREKIKPKEEQ